MASTACICQIDAVTAGMIPGTVIIPSSRSGVELELIGARGEILARWSCPFVQTYAVVVVGSEGILVSSLVVRNLVLALV